MTERIAAIALDEEGIRPRTPELEHERTVALTDLLHENAFSLVKHASGPYNVTLRVEESRLIFDVHNTMEQVHRVSLPLQPLKRLVRDYFLICESYYEALKNAVPHRLEAIDMGRRGVHNEGAQALTAMLESEIAVDHTTARRLFTLICVLHMK